MHKKLKAARKAKNLTQSDVAKQLGVTTSTVSNYEQGIRQPDWLMLQQIINIYELRMHDLLQHALKDTIELDMERHVVRIGQKFFKLPADKQAKIMQILQALEPVE